MTTVPATSVELASPKAAALFTPAELKRVGVAATMIVVTTTIIILGILAATGHYSSLSHCLPKAILDGATIAMLVGRRGRWRCVALLGAVYGLVLLLQVGVVYLVAVMTFAGCVAAMVGWATSMTRRTIAVVAAAIVYEVLASFGTPIKLFFATDGREPLLWMLWFAEWPLRIVGAAIGVFIGIRAQRAILAQPTLADPSVAAAATPEAHPVKKKKSKVVRRKGVAAAAISVVASIVACILPMWVNDWRWLGCIAGAYVVYALIAGVRWKVLTAIVGLAWGWVVFSAFSYAWHQDIGRVIDLLRTLVLRFAPLTFASTVLVATVRPVDVVRMLRRIWFPRVVILPFAHVLRELPNCRRDFTTAMATLRREGVWRGPTSLFTRPRRIATGLLGPQFRRWATELAE